MGSSVGSRSLPERSSFPSPTRWVGVGPKTCSLMALRPLRISGPAEKNRRLLDHREWFEFGKIAFGSLHIDHLQSPAPAKSREEQRRHNQQGAWLPRLCLRKISDRSANNFSLANFQIISVPCREFSTSEYGYYVRDGGVGSGQGLK